MKKLTGLPCLGHTVYEVESCHVLMRDLGINANHLRMFKRWYKTEIVTGCCHVNVSSRLIRLRLEREFITVATLDVVLAEIIHSFAQTLHRFVGAAAGVSLHAFAPTPEDENLCAELSAELHGQHCLLHSVGAYCRIIRSESAVAKNRMEEQ